MATTFQKAIADTHNGAEPCWRVLQPPTGSGKTRGACLYAAMQADINKAAQEQHNPVGVLVVTRLIDQANEMAAEINAHAGRVVAAAPLPDLEPLKCRSWQALRASTSVRPIAAHYCQPTALPRGHISASPRSDRMG
jgi:hypothetical protein